MAIKFDTFKTSTAGASDVTSVNGEQGDVIVTLDSATDQGATTTNSITVGGLSVGTAYSLPTADGTPNQSLITDGSGNLSFTTLDFTGGLEYKGTFNATAGTPSLANAEQGDYYKIDTAGTIYGQTWAVGDSLLINADMGGTITNSKIDKIDNTDTPASETVAGVIEIATNAEATAGTATDKALVPSNISSIALSSFNDDLSYLSSGDNVSLLTNDAGYLTGITSESLNDLSDVSFTAGAGIDNYVLTYDHATTSWGAEAVAGGYTFSAISSATTAQISYHYSCNTSGGAFTLTLPALSGVTAGQEIRVKLATAGNDLTIARTGSDTIDGLTSFTMSTAKSSITLVANTSGTDWEIV